MIREDTTKKSCTYTQRVRDTLHAAQPINESSLKKATCECCGNVFWPNSEREYCFDCKAKGRK